MFLGYFAFVAAKLRAAGQCRPAGIARCGEV